MPDNNCSATDRGILEELYRSTQGDQWIKHRNFGWCSEAPITIWHGITFDSYNNLTILQLSDRNMKGDMPPCIGSLHSLSELCLNNNSLSGEIPASYSQLVRITIVNISSNMITGPIPYWINQWKRLTALDFSDNRFSGEIPDSISKCSDLQILRLDHNQLDGLLPLSVCKDLTNLQTLQLAGNKFRGPIPMELCNHLTQLIVLDISANELEGSLLMGNAFKQLQRLSRLSLHGNNLSGEIPHVLFELTTLRELDLSANQFTGVIAACIGNLDKLLSLDLSGNMLSNVIPPTLSQLTNLTSLDLSHNQLCGSVAPEVIELLAHIINTYPNAVVDLSSTDIDIPNTTLLPESVFIAPLGNLSLSFSERTTGTTDDLLNAVILAASTEEDEDNSWLNDDYNEQHTIEAQHSDDFTVFDHSVPLAVEVPFNVTLLERSHSTSSIIRSIAASEGRPSDENDLPIELASTIPATAVTVPTIIIETTTPEIIAIPNNNLMTKDRSLSSTITPNKSPLNDQKDTSTKNDHRTREGQGQGSIRNVVIALAVATVTTLTLATLWRIRRNSK